ncbi:SCO family protein [Salipiger mucosus]|uniref:Cytochrome oxidase biogenesis protein Sco1/SenC/PrrC, putative copper metallochaperone n=1 Tax=Salipiger mucosus DSM 16094 TaxID=1123237 RepID=S9SCX7_9RHOB|nr:SCO family protein [Salipiger mucosus]EPX84079.1 Cytochrome oxidase biogenesis protein Sco1/SenC/PrrC, putative copper metallochaperone [Salipiger mucosus DSM 16094]
MARVRKLVWLLCGIGILVLGSAVLWQRTTSTPTAESEPAIVADFELTGHDGMVRTEEDLRGTWSLIFFGFTHCPDICPTTLADVAQVMDNLGPQASQVQPVFITVDPERDDVQALADYVPQFHPSFLGLTGTPAQIESTAKTFKVYYEKVDEPQAPNGYSMGHTSQLFLFNPQNELVRLFSYGTPPSEITADMEPRIAADSS